MLYAHEVAEHFNILFTVVLHHIAAWSCKGLST